MIEQAKQAIAGQLLWNKLKRQEHLDYRHIVLVLTGENEQVDQYALLYLDHLMDRKNANIALILSHRQACIDMVTQYRYRHAIHTRLLSQREIILLYKRYCLDRFFVNLFFTYVRLPKDNLMERFLKETEINEEDVVCLCLYNFRGIPTENVVNKNV